ncbi:YggS family pyridoxal phosphate-dependent enzyme [Caldifermentibacillus hisashii]|uniref:YggS family pyridoxal phosphate-dependent enzyme n=1 Tax=Caldifermentibacillus hisashii TaxID=996558 RepID=UPI001C125939|nr:YggS family pyridoxal phosphate-dependent enzyme [Caldifermentibacillus hisashii]MBU5341197.1 YggS family pyridoxal phosphate-dependent enzyme [Caldifermentibacillus hisashii]
MKSVESNLQIITEKIAKACEKVGRDPEEVTIIAVTKYVTIERAQEALKAGIIHLGENRDQELLKKYEVLGNQPVWHFIGTLQTRKVKKIIDEVDYIHSLDRLSLAEEIHKRANRKIPCFVQVNVSGEESKHGLPPEEVLPFIQQLAMYSNIEIIGLMTMAPYIKDEQILRNCFRSLKQLQDEIQNLKLPYAPCKELSMGMSNDYEIAVEEGATFVRIGTSLVGE